MHILTTEDLANDPYRGGDHLQRPAVVTHTDQAASARAPRTLQIFWERRRVLFRVTACGLVVAALIAFLMANRYHSTVRLLPSDNQTTSSRSMLLALSTGNAVAVT